MDSHKKIRPFHLDIENFRNFHDVSFDLGCKLTVISGQNGVGKSTLLSLIASGSGVNKKSTLGSNFQPEFYDFFNIDQSEDFENYKLYLTYAEDDGTIALTKRLSFKDDTNSGRGVRIIPRTTNTKADGCTLKQAEEKAKTNYSVGGSARVRIPTIYLSLSRLYPLGERKDTVNISEIKKSTLLYQKKANEKYYQWYNFVIPNSIKSESNLSKIEKKTCSRASLHMDIINTPTLSQSIGQDNLGNIISALVDIYMLSLDEEYTGALLCIDEIDVSLHPDTQIRLLDLFEKVSNELNIQFIVSTHSLTILKEMIKRESKNDSDYKVVYLKTPSAPYVTECKSYDLLKADMFGSLSFNRPKVKIYFEDPVGKKIFEMLLNAFRKIFHSVESNTLHPALRNSSEVSNFTEYNKRISNLCQILKIAENTKQIPTILGCEELLHINEADDYFKRVIFILDGDARYKATSQKPKVKDYLECEYDQKSLGLTDRQHTKNVCFLPNYFAPESFLYAIIYRIAHQPMEHAIFWRGLDSNESTALYTSEKILDLFSKLPDEFNNNDLKAIFTTSFDSEAWEFVQKSDIVAYFYSDYKTIGELLDFFENIKKAYEMTLPLTISNRYS